jgi:hypothetical protein
MRETRTAMADITRPLMTGALAEISVGGPGLGRQIAFNLSPNSSEQIVLNLLGESSGSSGSSSSGSTSANGGLTLRLKSVSQPVQLAGTMSSPSAYCTGAFTLPL